MKLERVMGIEPNEHRTKGFPPQIKGFVRQINGFSGKPMAAYDKSQPVSPNPRL
ncbi:MAG: hypothetical protein H8E27_06165 [Verrucomicrobia subdivision 3 bacterium]|nr:hypothetical protein [Limisphaerales bacterium]